jgi:hypothetical protein
LSKVFRISPEKVKIPERVLAARLGFKGVGKIPEEFSVPFKKAYSLAMEVASPVALYKHYKSTDSVNGVIVNGKEIPGKLAKQHLGGSKEVSLILSSLGLKYDEKIEELHEKGEELLSFFLDGIGSELVEYFTRMLDAKLREEKGIGGARISPGYGDLPISLNAWIIETLEGEKYGITYDPETFVMKPRKTISALIGWKEGGVMR